jgi:hypothetical protein
VDPASPHDVPPPDPWDLRWYDDEAGPVVRPYTMTGGRTRPTEDGLFDLVAVVTAVDPAEQPPPGAEPEPVLAPEQHTILELCGREPLTVAEVASGLGLPVGVVRVLLGDLHDAGLIRVTRPVPPAQLPDERILREVINGLRAL